MLTSHVQLLLLLSNRKTSFLPSRFAMRIFGTKKLLHESSHGSLCCASPLRVRPNEIINSNDSLNLSRTEYDISLTELISVLDIVSVPYFLKPLNQLHKIPNHHSYLKNWDPLIKLTICLSVRDLKLTRPDCEQKK